MKILIVGIFLTVVLVSCDNASTKVASSLGRSKTENDSLFRIHEGNYHFSIFLPRDLMISNAPEIGRNGANGELSIRIGSDFHLLALPGEADFESMKSRLNDDGVFTNRIITEEQAVILYQQFLPDSTPYYFHILGIRELAGGHTAFRSHPDGQFTREQAERMMDAVRSVTPGDVHITGP